MGIDLSKVQLPAEDANKPADLDFNPAGDGEAASNVPDADKNQQLPTDDREGLTTKLGATEGEDRDLILEDPTPEEKPAADKPVEDPEKKEAAPTDPKPEDKKVEDPKPDADPEKKEDPEKPEEKEEAGDKTDFHNHPDWKKRDEQLRTVELEKAKLEGKLEVMEKKGLITEEKKEEAKTAAQIAEDRVEAKYKDGWKPKDALELNKVYSQEFEKALDEKEAAKEEAREAEQKAFNERKTEIQKQVDAVYAEEKITEKDDQDKVANLALDWAQKGIANYSINTLKLAADHLKAKGEIGKPKTNDPAPVKDPPADPENKDTKPNKDDINRKITRPTNEGGSTNTPPKKSIGDLRRKSLDDIVLENAGALG